MKLAGINYVVAIDEKTTLRDLEAFVRKEMNHWVELFDDDGRRIWTYEIAYESIYDPDLGYRIFDDDITVGTHTNKLADLIYEDFQIKLK